MRNLRFGLLVCMISVVACGKDADKPGDESADPGKSQPEPPPPDRAKTGVRVKQVGVGMMHTCAILEDDTLKCWGNLRFGSAPAGTFTQLSVGMAYACAIGTDGVLACWGVEQQTAPPEGTFTHVSVGYAHSCAVRADGRAICWGESGTKATRAPKGKFAQVSAGQFHSCGIRTDGSLACWGMGKGKPPKGKFSQVVAMAEYSCALREDGTVACWGKGPEAPEGTYSYIDATMGVRTDGSIALWLVDSMAPEDGTFSKLVHGRQHSCGLQLDGAIQCWGDAHDGKLDAPPGSFQGLAAAGDTTCAHKKDGTVACWGYGFHDQRVTPPKGTFAQVSAWCGIRENGKLECWNRISIPPDSGDIYTQVSSGTGPVCGITKDKAIKCFGGNNLSRETTPPAGSFERIAMGEKHGCALRSDHSLVCWGDEMYDQNAAPSGKYTDVVAASNHSCALRADAVVCWGKRYGQATVIRDQFKTISPWCGTREDGSVRCWTFAALEPPPGKFRQVSAGSQVCAVAEDGRVVCWGENKHGEASPPQ